MKASRVVAALMLLAALAAGPALAQSLTGTIAGTITDEQGGALPGVTVTLVGKQRVRTAQSASDGTFRFPGVDPGTYVVRAELAGFRAARQEEVQVVTGKQATVDFKLAVGGLTEQVEVVGEAQMVDVTSSSSSTVLDQDFLFNLPVSRTNAAVNTLNYFPGVNSGSAYGGDADAGNALMLDGVDTRDPEAGTAWTFFNYNIIEEVQVGGLGAPAEFGAFTGAFVNTITKSGGNRYAGLFDLNYTNDGDLFSSNNITDEVKRANPALADPAKTTKLLDVTAQLSGPLVKDKLFFFASMQRYERETDPTGPVTRRHEVSPRVNTKLTWTPGPNDTVTGTLQYDSYNIIGRPGVSALLANDTLTNREDAPEWVWMGNWRHLFGPNTFSEVKFAGYTGFFDLNPEVNRPGRYDAASGAFSVSQGWYYWADRNRNQVNASISHFAEGWGKHDLKFGVEIERSKVRSRYGYVNDIFYYDYEGAPYYGYNYGYDLEGRNRRESFFAQDSWKVTDRLTLNPGVRFDWIRGLPRDGDKVLDTKSLAPRIGFAFDVTGDNRTVLKAFYGQYYEGAFFQAFSGATTGFKDFVGYDLSRCPSINAPCPRSLWTEVNRYVYPIYRVDSDLKHPRVDEFMVGFERAFGRDFRFTVTGVWRNDANFIGSVMPDARFLPVTLNTATAEGFTSRQVTAYRWANRSASERNMVITNPDGFAFRDPSGNVIGTIDARQKYRAIMAVLQRRFANRWQGQISYVYSKAEGTVGNAGSTLGGAAFSRTYQLPNNIVVNTDGPLNNDRPHEVKVYFTWQAPVVETSLNILYRGYSGRPWTATQRFASSQIGGHGFPFGSGRTIFVEPRGSRRLEFEHILDLRVEKIFKLGGGSDRLSVYADVFNALNKGTIIAKQARVPNLSIAGVTDPILFGGPTGITTARQIQLGARWSF